MKKPPETWSTYIFGSGTSQDVQFIAPSAIDLEYIDFGVGLMIGELAAATVTSYVNVLAGSSSPGIPTSNLIASVVQTGRSNATFASMINLSKVVYPKTRHPSRSILQISWLAAANHTLSGWITFGFIRI